VIFVKKPKQAQGTIMYFDNKKGTRRVPF
jgi:hypothetical protein